MDRLLIVSNRLPVSVSKKENRLQFSKSVGGLATGLEPFCKSRDCLWLGWPGISSESLNAGQKRLITERLKKDKCLPIYLSGEETEKFYYGFSNKTIWPLFHYFPQYTVYSEDLYKGYEAVNRIFCEKVLEEAKPNDTIWIHDYHLMLLPGMIRERMPDAKIGFFLHIPFPSYEMFSLLPWRAELMNGILGSDLVGFHTYNYIHHFLFSARRLLGYESSFGQLIAGERRIKVDCFPMGIDYKKFSGASAQPEVKKKMDSFRRAFKEHKVILSIDRLDYSKGVLQRLNAFEVFLRDNPQYRKKAVFVLVVVPSRTPIGQYGQLKKDIDEMVGKISGKYGTMDYNPITYIYRRLSDPELMAFYNVADIALITPLRDGMNLISKEYIASKNDGNGILIISETTGAAGELGEALIVNPNDTMMISRALKTAFEMDEGEQKKRMGQMQERLRRYDITRWTDDFLHTLDEFKKSEEESSATRITAALKEKLISSYRESRKRFFILDYDGTLVPFADFPKKAEPDREMLRILGEIAKNPKNEVMILSGRDRATLDEWFSGVNVRLAAEHGAWIKGRDGKWEATKPQKNEWKGEARQILEMYVDRTPGTFVEEKDFSLVWHYRRAHPGLASLRVRELKEVLLNYVKNLGLTVAEGNKILEIKNTDINKGNIAAKILSKERPDFILAAGDDSTDEDLFAAMPRRAYSIKVGTGASHAKFGLPSVSSMRSLLEELSRQG